MGEHDDKRDLELTGRRLVRRAILDLREQRIKVEDGQDRVAKNVEERRAEIRAGTRPRGSRFRL